MKTLCVVPAFNEADALPAVVAGCRRAGLPVLVVDDGSSDETAARARAAGAEVLRHARNLGKGRAIESGVERAAAEDFDAVVFLDADGQHDPAELPAFLAAFEAGADLVVGCRDFDARMPFVRRATNRFQSWLLARVAGRPLGDTQCGYRLVRVPLWPRIRPKSGGFVSESEMLVRAARAGARLAFVPIRTIYLEGRRSRIRPLRDVPLFCLFVLRLLLTPEAGGGTMKALSAAALIALAVPALGSADEGRPVRFHRLASAEERAALLKDDLSKTAELPERLRAVGERFLGTPYVLGPLGEGPEGEFDRGPLVSFSALDCTTFVEETMAFALAGSYADGLDLLRRIRYKGGRVGYATRNHFPETDWLPNLAAAGFLADVTTAVAGGRARVARKVISKRDWYLKKTEADLKGFETEPPAARSARLRRLRALGAGLPDEQAALPYVPLEDLDELLPSVPSGTVASLVREDRPDKPTLVTHQFFIMDGPKGKFVRHAAYGKTVEDVPAEEYFARFKGASWRVLGINLAEVQAGNP